NPKYQYNKYNIADDIYKNSKIHKKNKRTIWKCGISNSRNSHIATYPAKLIEPCILAGSSEGEWVLDPFLGSGTTGVACLGNDRNFVGIELNKKYFDFSLKVLENSDNIFSEKIKIDQLK
ncbi:MAG: DNA methyltransferase, partial [archaeon]